LAKEVESGSPVNLEVDLIGKYVEKMLATRLKIVWTIRKRRLQSPFLQEKGYL
jgi:riboflavin synthase alpha subunit